MTFKIGVTGTRSGMTNEQRACFTAFIRRKADSNGLVEFHHGDCVGVDVEAAEIAASLGCVTVSHPPEKQDLRAFHESAETREPFSYFKRNRNIVDEVDLLVVIPYQMEWCSSGGTWYTHDYAEKTKVELYTIWPDDNVKQLMDQGR